MHLELHGEGVVIGGHGSQLFQPLDVENYISTTNGKHVQVNIK